MEAKQRTEKAGSRRKEKANRGSVKEIQQLQKIRIRKSPGQVGFADPAVQL